MMTTRPRFPFPPSARTTMTLSPEQVHDADVMCRYPSKRCWNPRALKRNGERHNLCDFHRQKANKNQRRLELKRKARAQAFMDSEPAGKRLRAHKKTRQRARRAPLSAHLAMKEEARGKQQVEEVSQVLGLTSWFFQDLVLLDGTYDQGGFQVKDELPVASASSIELPHLSDVVDEEALDRILQDEQRDVGKGLDSASVGMEALVSMPEGKTSPVDVGGCWDGLEFADYWLPADQPTVNIDAFVGDEDVFVADV
ncbi:unnamed protein product [Peronospora destructor]|uniref:WRC domain-containing protein n=2 Tax=Peronospora destructor TaxID=86335 RepID=A0AAV0V8X5_9STRA|nr:unnamed protein product [Peronospora destructor]